MCTHRIINPGLPPEELDAFYSDEERSDPIEDEHHSIFDCSAYANAREQYRDLFQSHITTRCEMAGTSIGLVSRHSLAYRNLWSLYPS